MTDDATPRAIFSMHCALDDIDPAAMTEEDARAVQEAGNRITYKLWKYFADRARSKLGSTNEPPESD